MSLLLFIHFSIKLIIVFVSKRVIIAWAYVKSMFIFLVIFLIQLCLCSISCIKQFWTAKFLVLFAPYLLGNRYGQYQWEDHRPRSGIWKGTNGGEVISFSGCDDDQTSADTSVSFIGKG